MGVQYELVNATKREWLSFGHLPGAKARELAGQPASAAIVTWYLLHNRGDRIAFVSDHEEAPPAPEFEIDRSWPDVTDRIVDELIDAEILRDDGRQYEDPDCPDEVYVRRLTNVWFDA